MSDTATPPTIELHTSELSTVCLRQAQLRLEGKEIRVAETALVRGLIAHQCLEDLHNTGDWCVDAAYNAVARKLDEEGRQMTAAPQDKRDEIQTEVAEVVGQYAERCLSMVDELVGCEIPLSLDCEIAGVPVRIASHLDNLFRGTDADGNPAMVLRDWKFRDEEPSFDYLRRNPQLQIYQWAAKQGGLIVGGWPYELPTDLPLVCEWVHLPNLKPYKRGGSSTTENGTRTWRKGDTKPLDKVLMRVPYDEAWVDQFLSERVQLIAMNLWPATPTPKGCFLCQSATYCTGGAA